MIRVPFLKFGGLFGTRPATRPRISSRSFVAVMALAAAVGFSTDAVAFAAMGRWLSSGACAAVCALIAVLWRAWSRWDLCCRWRDAIQRRDRLVRDRAERVRLHRRVDDIDAELRPLVNRMISGRP